jgi:hypothetical protein
MVCTPAPGVKRVRDKIRGEVCFDLNIKIGRTSAVTPSHCKEVVSSNQNIVWNRENETCTGRAIIMNLKPARDISSVDKHLDIVVDGDAYRKIVGPEGETEVLPQQYLGIHIPICLNVCRVVEVASCN